MSGNAPAKGDFVHLDFDPQAGHEQAGSRFGLVLSPCEFNAVTGFAYVAPITSKVKGYPFELPIPPWRTVLRRRSGGPGQKPGLRGQKPQGSGRGSRRTGGRSHSPAGCHLRVVKPGTPHKNPPACPPTRSLALPSIFRALFPALSLANQGTLTYATWLTNFAHTGKRSRGCPRRGLESGTRCGGNKP